MSQDQTNPPESKQPDQPNPPPKKKRRLWLKILLVIVILIVGLVLLAPTIASMGFVRSIVLGKVNEQLNGSVEIADWSFGWFSPISVSGIKVYDSDKALILEVARVKLGISVLGAIRQNFALGNDNVIDVASFVVRQDQAGKTNLEKLPKSSGPRAPKPEGQPHPASAETPTKLPNVSGKFTVNILQGTVESTQAPPIHLQDSVAVVTIADINQPIENSVKLNYRVGDSAVSTIETSGSVEAIKNNLLDISKLNAGQKIDLKGVNLAAVEPFLKSLGANTKLAGMASGGIEIKAEGLTGLSAKGEIDIQGVSFGGGPLGADTFATEKIAIPINVSQSMVDGKPVISFDNVGVQMSQAAIHVTGRVSQAALQNLQNKQAPGDTGTISITADITDLKSLTTQLKNTLKLQQGVAVTGGAVHEQIDINFEKDRITLAQKLNASANGTNGTQEITLQPINITAQASALPNGKPIPEVKDIKLAVQSVFATLQGGGDSLAKINIKGNIDLAKLRAEAGQFVDFKNVQMEGSADLAINTDGDVTDENAPIKAGLTVNLQNVKVTTGVASQGINQDRLAIAANGQLTRTKNSPTGISGAAVTITSGDPASPLLTTQLNADVDLSDPSKIKVSKWQINSTISSLATLQQQYGGLVPALAQQGITIKSGNLQMTAAGGFDGTTAQLTTPLSLSIASLTVSKGQQNLLNGETVRANAAGSVTLGADQTNVSLGTLSLTTQSNIFAVSKSGDAPLSITMLKAGAIQGSGTLAMAADLPRLATLGQAFSGAAPSKDQPQLKGGQFTSTFTVSTADQTKLDFNGQINGLTIVTNGKTTIDNEQLTIALNATAPSDLNSKDPITAKGKIGSSFVNATLSDIKIALQQASIYDMLQAATVDVQVPDLPKLDALANSITGAPQPVAGQPPAPPMQITSGDATLKLNVARDSANKITTVNLTDAQVKSLVLHRGKLDYTFDARRPISFKLQANIKAASPIQSIEVKSLSGDLRVATLEMPTPIVIDMSTDKPTYKGAIKVAGTIDAVTPLLALLQNAEPLPYGGQYQLNETISTAGSNTSLNGSIDVNQFKVFGANHKEVVFAEDQVAIKNDVSVDLDKNVAMVNSLTVDMPKSQAVGVKFNGKVSDWVNARQIAGVKSDKAQLDLTYDLEKVWPIIKPMLSPDMQKQYATLKIKGKYTKSFTVSGAFPNKPTAQQSLASLNADGSLGLELLDLPQGLELKVFELPFSMKSGVLKLLPAPAADARKLQVQPRTASARGGTAAPRQIVANTAVANDGALNLDGITLDLTQPAPVLTIAAKHVLLQDVKLNALLAASLGKMGALVFSDAKTAEGLVTFTVNECNNVPLGDLLLKKNNAKAAFTLVVDDLLLDGPVLQILSAAADLGTGGIRGNVPPSTIVMNNGQIDTNMTVLIDKTVADARGRQTLRGMPLKLTGAIGLEKQDLRNFVVDISPELELREIRKVAPNGAVIPLEGTTSNIKLDVVKFIRDNAIKSILGGQDDGKGGKPNPLGGILDQLTKPKK